MSAFETEDTAIPEPKSLSSEREYEEVLQEALEKMHRMSRHETDLSHVPPHAGPEASASTETCTQDSSLRLAGQHPAEMGTEVPATQASALVSQPLLSPDFEERVLEQLAELNQRFAQRIAEDGAKNQLIRSVQASLQERDERASGEAYRSLFRDVLNALDRLLNQEASASLSESVADEIVSIFEIRGLQRIDAVGKFNPAIHEVSGVVPSAPDYPAGTVVSVEREGYILGDRTLRPARVIVARDMPNRQPAASSGTAATHPQGAAENGTGGSDEDDRTLPLPTVPNNPVPNNRSGM